MKVNWNFLVIAFEVYSWFSIFIIYLDYAIHSIKACLIGARGETTDH